MASSNATMLSVLLSERFFNSCLLHVEEGKKNEENCFCMDCCFSLCFHCLTHHQSHNILQIRRYMYSDVLRLKDAQKIFDCSLIQSYTTNGERVVLLRPKERVAVPIRGSRCTCLVCGQSVKTSFVYCSMVCKFNTVTQSGKGIHANSSHSPDHSASGAESLDSMESEVAETSEVATPVEETNYEIMDFAEEGSHAPRNIATSSTKGFVRKFHARKRVPQRSPLF